MLPPLPAIAREILAPPLVWRAAVAILPDDDMSAADFVRQQRDAAGLPLELGADLLAYLDTYHADAVLWVSFSRAPSPRFGDASNLVALRLDIPALVLATDHAGGFLLFFPDDEDKQSLGGAAMAQQDDTTAPRPLDQQPDQLAAIPKPAEPDDEDERRKGRGGGGENPAFATHSFNIRPDVVDTPAGLAVQTTMKSADYRAQPNEPDARPAHPDVENASDRLRAMLEGRAERSLAEGDTRQLEPTLPRRLDLADATTPERAPDDTQRAAFNQVRPLDEPDSASACLAAMLDGGDRPAAPQQEAETPHDEAAARQADDKSKREQEADRLARNGEASAADPSLTATDRLAAMLEGSTAKAEREADAEGQEIVFREPTDAGRGGGRGMI